MKKLLLIAMLAQVAVVSGQREALCAPPALTQETAFSAEHACCKPGTCRCEIQAAAPAAAERILPQEVRFAPAASAWFSPVQAAVHPAIQAAARPSLFPHPPPLYELFSVYRI